MSIHISDLAERSIALWFSGREFETYDEFEDALYEFEEQFIEELHEVLENFVKLDNDSLSLLGITMKEMSGNEPTAREEALRDLREETINAVRGDC